MIKSFPFKSINGDRKYCADDFALHEKTLYTNGIIGNQNNNLQVFAHDGMTIKIRPGFALIEGHTFINTEDYIVDVEYAGNIFNRIDRLVLKLDYSNREIIPFLKKGKESSNPTPPNLEQTSDVYEIGLADIRVNKGIIKIQQDLIRDLRHTNLCGISTFKGQPINVHDLYIQYENNLKNMIDKHKNEIIYLLDDLNELIETQNLAGMILGKIDKKQDKNIKDIENNSKYQLLFKNGQLFYKEV